MSGRIGWLSGLLALQLVIIAVVLLSEAGFGEEEQGPLFAFEADAVDEVRITGDGDAAETLVLSRAGNGWTLPSGLPADGNKVQDVLNKLAGLEAPWPVATSGDAAERFEVTESAFQRHVVLLADGEPLADLYLGTSPGYQQVHARRADDDAVYSVALSNYQVPTKSDEWLDKTLLQPRGEVTKVARADAWEISEGEEGWLMDGAAANQQAVEDLLRRIRELRVTGVAAAPEADAEPAGVLAISDNEGSYELRLYGSGDGAEYRVVSDRRDGAFKVSGYIADQLLVDQETLVAAADDPAEQDAANQDEADAAAAEAAAAAGDPDAQEPGA